MPAKEIKELRQSGKLQEAFDMAKAELDTQPDNVWAKRNMSWVLYDYLKQNTSVENFEAFHNCLERMASLQLPKDEKMLFDHLAWQIGKMVFQLSKETPVDHRKVIILLTHSKAFPFSKPSEGYSFLFKAFHKCLKETKSYVEYADWWDFKNFLPTDYAKEKLPNGKELMSIVEQACIAYAKHLLPWQNFDGGTVFDKEKVTRFLPYIENLIENHPEFQYPPYFHAKLLLSIGDNENVLSALLPFAKKKRSEFWVWDVLSEAFPGDEQKIIACYCRALTCKTSDDFLINIRQKMASWFIKHSMFNEAKTEIERIIKAREANEWKLPTEVRKWIEQSWYKNAIEKKSNFDFYKRYVPLADNLLYSDIVEETVVIEFVNTDKNIANFIASEEKFGFFKFDRFIKILNVGDIVKVRFDGNGSDGLYKILTLEKAEDDNVSDQFIKSIKAELRIGEGKAFGFLQDAFVHPNFVKKYKLQDKQLIQGKAVKSFNANKKLWGWKLFEVGIV